MPRVGRAKIRRHASAVALVKSQSECQTQPEPLVLETPQHSLPVESHVKTKRVLKLPPQPSSLISGKAPHPYFVPSKSHLRRQKRKARNIANGLSSLETALEGVLVENFPEVDGKNDTELKTKKEEMEEKRRRVLEGQKEKQKIGEGKGRTLGEKKRREIIQEGAKRIPAVMQHPTFQQNPWATIREHAGNTLAQKTVNPKKQL
ncbi:hypothetical protein L204_102031 [Cryptococcus depauperatus]